MSRVKAVMVGGDQVPPVMPGPPAITAVEEIDRKNLGFVLIVDGERRLQGILTDGDIRRCVKRGEDFGNRTVDELMTRSPKTVDENLSLAETLESMERDEITTLVVVDDEQRVKGYVHLHDILGRGGTVRMSVSI
jgi:arabinose-5-phosphate isomerase